MKGIFYLFNVILLFMIYFILFRCFFSLHANKYLIIIIIASIREDDDEEAFNSLSLSCVLY